MQIPWAVQWKFFFFNLLLYKHAFVSTDIPFLYKKTKQNKISTWQNWRFELYVNPLTFKFLSFSPFQTIFLKFRSIQ